MRTSVKTCFKCGVERPYTDFYKHPKMADGYLGKCKECAKRDVTENRLRRIEYYKEFDRQRAMLPHRVKARIEYSHTPQGKLSLIRAKKKFILKNPEKRQAHNILNNAIRSGILEKPRKCEVCGNTKHRIHGHHADYSKPLNVNWLCPPCHTKEHRK